MKQAGLFILLIAFVIALCAWLFTPAQARATLSLLLACISVPLLAGVALLIGVLKAGRL